MKSLKTMQYLCEPSLVQPRPLAQPDYDDLEDGFVVEGQQDDDFCELAVPSAKEAFTALNTVRNFLLAEGLTDIPLSADGYGNQTQLEMPLQMQADIVRRCVNDGKCSSFRHRSLV